MLSWRNSMFMRTVGVRFHARQFGVRVVHRFGAWMDDQLMNALVRLDPESYSEYTIVVFDDETNSNNNNNYNGE